MPTAVVSEGEKVDIENLLGMETSRQFRRGARSILLACDNVEQAKIRLERLIILSQQFAADKTKEFATSQDRSDFPLLFTLISSGFRHPRLGVRTWDGVVRRYLGKSGMINLHQDLGRKSSR